MDNLPTEQPSVQPVVTPATPALQPTVQPAPMDAGATPPSSNKIIFIVVAAVVALVLAYLGYAMMSAPSTATREDEKISAAPPSLSVAKSALKGSFSDTDPAYNCMKFTEEEAKNYKPPVGTDGKTAKYAELEGNVLTPVATIKKMTWKEAALSLDPVGGRICMAFYDPTIKKFKIYPKGPFDGTVTMQEPQFSTEYIESGRAGFIISGNATRAYNFANSKTIFASADVTALDPNLEGWILHPATKETAGEELAQFKGRNPVMFVHKSKADFEKVTDMSKKLNNFIYWVYLKKQTGGVSGGGSTETAKTTTIKTNSLKPITLNATGVTTTQTQDVTLEGENLDAVDTITSSDSGIVIKSIVVTATKITFKVEVSSTTTAGDKVLTMNGKDGKPITTLKVTASAPAITTLSAPKITSPANNSTIDVTKDLVLSWEAVTTLPVGTTAVYIPDVMEGVITSSDKFKQTATSDTDKTTMTMPKDVVAKVFLPGKSYTFGVKVSAMKDGKPVLSSDWSFVTLSVAAASTQTQVITLKTSDAAPSAITFTSPKDKDSFKIEDLQKNGLVFAATDPNKESYNLSKTDGKTYFMNYTWSLKSKAAKDTDAPLWSAGWEYNEAKMKVDAKCLATFTADNKNYMTCPGGTIPASVFTNISSGDYILTGEVGDGKKGTSTFVTVSITNTNTAESRDAQRLADLQAIKKAIDASYSEKKKYPANVATTFVIPAEVLSVPTKDSEGKPYYYRNIGDVCYVLGALMELEKNGHTGLPGDKKISDYISGYTCETAKGLTMGKGLAHLSFTVTPDPIVTKISPIQGVEKTTTKVFVEGKNLDPKTLEVIGTSDDGKRFIWNRNNVTGTSEKVEFNVGSTTPGAKPGTYKYQITMLDSKGAKITLKEFDFTIEAMKVEIEKPVPSEIDPMTEGTISIKGKNFSIGSTIISPKNENEKLQISVNGYYNTESELVFDYKDTGAAEGDHVYMLEFNYKDGTAYKGEFTIHVNKNTTTITSVDKDEIEKAKDFVLTVTGTGFNKVNTAKLEVGSYYDLEISEKTDTSLKLKGNIFGNVDANVKTGTISLGVNGKELAKTEIEIK